MIAQQLWSVVMLNQPYICIQVQQTVQAVELVDKVAGMTDKIFTSFFQYYEMLEMGFVKLF